MIQRPGYVTTRCSRQRPSIFVKQLFTFFVHSNQSASKLSVLLLMLLLYNFSNSRFFEARAAFLNAAPVGRQESRLTSAAFVQRRCFLQYRLRKVSQSRTSSSIRPRKEEQRGPRKARNDTLDEGHNELIYCRN